MENHAGFSWTNWPSVQIWHISQSYHHIDIDEQHQKYLDFSWKIKGQTKYFVFTVMAFGLTSAPFLFTKVMRCLVTFWRAQGIKISVSWSGTIHHTFSRYQKSLTEADFIINTQKSIWQPQRELTWLGVNINLDKIFFFYTTNTYGIYFLFTWKIF